MFPKFQRPVIASGVICRQSFELIQNFLASQEAHSDNQDMNQHQFKRARTQQKKNLRRETILEEAKELFSTQDFRHIRMEELAKKCQIAKGTLYLYFSTKEEVFAELFLRKLDAFFNDIAVSYVRPKIHLHANENARLMRMHTLASHFSKHIEHLATKNEDLFEMWSMVQSTLIPNLTQTCRDDFYKRWAKINQDFALHLQSFLSMSIVQAYQLTIHLSSFLLGAHQMPTPGISSGIYYLLLGMGSEQLLRPQFDSAKLSAISHSLTSHAPAHEPSDIERDSVPYEKDLSL